jgi:hypothetical protein
MLSNIVVLVILVIIVLIKTKENFTFYFRTPKNIMDYTCSSIKTTDLSEYKGTVPEIDENRYRSDRATKDLSNPLLSGELLYEQQPICPNSAPFFYKY